jgi:beta-lactam-binding protein with PASTA domain/tRNA A-37 threonylcarbamoyl transferase component Bud32
LSASERTYGGRYAVVEHVGHGGMADVYRARDELLGREVALKVLSERFARDRSFVERFRREAQSAAALSHPNIVSLYDYGSDNGTYFIVMEYIAGKPLSDVITAEGSLMPERAVDITADVARALQRAHDAGLVHRDVKPSNIMITDSGQTKVTDFGIARALTRDGEQTVTQTGMVLGTAAYLSPEQAQGDPVDPRSDVYSLGCVLYEMITGRPPFRGETPLSVAYKHVRENPTPPSAVNPDVPEDLDAVVLKMMAKNPDNRYDDAGALLSDLNRLQAGQRVQATPLLADSTMVAPAGDRTEVISETGYGEEEQRRGPWWYVLVTLLLLGVFGLLAWLLANALLGETVQVPKVVGLQQEEAQRRLDDAGLEWDVKKEPHNRRPVGEVFRQDPEAREQIDEGGTVTIFVSTGPKEVEVPDLRGLTVDEAKSELREVDLKLGEVTREPNPEFEEGEIFEQDPDQGETALAGDRVDVTVASGEVSVPSVIGQTEEEAVAELKGLGFEVDVIRDANDEFAEGRVFAQDPEAGAPASPGEDVVTISVSEGPEERPMPDVTGMPADDAESLLEEDYGLNVSRADGACPDQPPGYVCDQDPPQGTPVAPGDDATIFVQPGEASLDPGLSLFGWLFFSYYYVA